MRVLTILLITCLTVPPLIGQSSDRIEMSRDVEYFRNTRPDTVLPDVYLSADYPELPDISITYPPPLIKRISEKKEESTGYVVLDPYNLFLPVPVVSRQVSDRRVSDFL